MPIIALKRPVLLSLPFLSLDMLELLVAATVARRSAVVDSINNNISSSSSKHDEVFLVPHALALAAVEDIM